MAAVEHHQQLLGVLAQRGDAGVKFSGADCAGIHSVGVVVVRQQKEIVAALLAVAREKHDRRRARCLRKLLREGSEGGQHARARGLGIAQHAHLRRGIPAALRVAEQRAQLYGVGGGGFDREGGALVAANAN